jgi:hypothetical protein
MKVYNRFVPWFDWFYPEPSSLEQGYQVIEDGYELYLTDLDGNRITPPEPHSFVIVEPNASPTWAE